MAIPSGSVTVTVREPRLAGSVFHPLLLNGRDQLVRTVGGMDRDKHLGRLVRGHRDMLLLAAIGAGQADASVLVQELENRSGGVIRPRLRSVHLALHRLWRAGYLARELESVGGRGRLTYRLTSTGRELLAIKRDEWDEVDAAVTAVIAGLSPAAGR